MSGWFVILLLLACAPGVWARVAVVRTLSGEVFSGHVRFVNAGVVVVNALRNFVLTVPGTNVAELVFDESPRPLVEEFAGGLLPQGWSEAEVGGPHAAGGTRVEGRSFVVRGAGAGMGGQGDSFHFVYRRVRGDSEIVARVSSIQYSHPEARSGLMMRERLAGHARHVTLGMTAWRGGAFQARHFEARPSQVAAQSEMRPWHWVKLRRRGAEISGYKSRDGRQWVLIETAHVPMPEEICVGLVVASAREDVVNWTTFDHVREAPKLMREDFTPQIELMGGSVIVGRPSFADTEAVGFVNPPGWARLPTPAVTRLLYAPLSSDLWWKTQASRPGVWVRNGDYFDGDFQGISGDRVRMSSVLYGLRTFDVDDEVVAVVLRSRAVTEPKVELLGVDGSVLLASAMWFADGDVVLKEPALGEVRVPAIQIAELRRR